MDAGLKLPPLDRAQEHSIVRTGFVACDAPDAMDQLADALGPSEMAVIILFLSPKTDLAALSQALPARFDHTLVVGCTTAGEIGPNGYSEGDIVALGLPAAHFAASTMLIDDLHDLNPSQLIARMIHNRNALAQAKPDWSSECAFLMVDGLSTREDALAAELAVGLGPVPLFGGSAGDGEEFGATYVLHHGTFRTNAAVLVQIRSNCPIKVFKTDHLQPTEQRMVVTGADPARRIVYEINAEPAAREYARLLGKDPEQLSTFTFAAHPVVVRIGDQTHVRAIQQVTDDKDLVFFSAIDEGVVLTLAEPEDMVAHLDRELSALSQSATPDMILGCDCLFRRVEATEKQVTSPISKLLQKHRVIGFSTYGEQVNSMHVNHTLTGVAIYPPTER